MIEKLYIDPTKMKKGIEEYVIKKGMGNIGDNLTSMETYLLKCVYSLSVDIEKLHDRE